MTGPETARPPPGAECRTDRGTDHPPKRDRRRRPVTDTARSTTTGRAGQLAADLDAVTRRIIETVAGCTDEQWRRATAAEG